MPVQAGRLLRSIVIGDLVGAADPDFVGDPESNPIPESIIGYLDPQVGGLSCPRGVKVAYGWTGVAGAPYVDPGTVTLEFLELMVMDYPDGVTRIYPWASTVAPLMNQRESAEFLMSAGAFTVRVSSVAAADDATNLSIFWGTF